MVRYGVPIGRSPPSCPLQASGMRGNRKSIYITNSSYLGPIWAISIMLSARSTTPRYSPQRISCNTATRPQIPRLNNGLGGGKQVRSGQPPRRSWHGVKCTRYKDRSTAAGCSGAEKQCGANKPSRIYFNISRTAPGGTVATESVPLGELQPSWPRGCRSRPRTLCLSLEVPVTLLTFLLTPP